MLHKSDIQMLSLGKRFSIYCHVILELEHKTHSSETNLQPTTIEELNKVCTEQITWFPWQHYIGCRMKHGTASYMHKWSPYN